MMSTPSLEELGVAITARLRDNQEGLTRQWLASGPVRHLAIDDLLPDDWVRAAGESFPPMGNMRRYQSLKERKGISVDFDAHAPLLKAMTFAFHLPDVVAMVGKVTGIPELFPDKNLYSGGLSAMGEGDFLNPHIDNSGNPFLNGYRRINSLFYVTPDWNPSWGGSLELWDARRSNPKTLEARCNRLVLMNTNRTSVHSVSPIQGCGPRTRKCVSNYFFSRQSPEGYDYFHVTAFRGRPEQPLRDLWLRLDALARGAYRKIRPRRPEEISHRYP